MKFSSTLIEIPDPDFFGDNRKPAPSKTEPVALTALQSTDDSPNPHPASNQNALSASCVTLTVYAEEGSKSDSNV